MSKKNQLTPAAIEPATFRFVAKHLNHCATAVPEEFERYVKKRPCKRAALFVGALLGNVEEVR